MALVFWGYKYFVKAQIKGKNLSALDSYIVGTA